MADWEEENDVELQQAANNDPRQWADSDPIIRLVPGLRIPDMPDQDTIDRHNISHCPPEPWCPYCAMGKARGERHLAIPLERKRGEIQAEYTFWSYHGIALEKDREAEAAITSLTLIDTDTGMALSTYVLKKGVWSFAVSLVRRFIQSLRKEKPVLRGDAETSLQNFLNE
eukprot:10329735-Alexandrium_andersonii.AAC.1